jgi:hypothetical protein
MDYPLSQLASAFPSELDLLSVLKFVFIFACISLILSLLGRIIFGHRSAWSRAVSTTIGIIFIYVVAIIVYTFNPESLSKYLPPLPFIGFSQQYLYIMPFHATDFPTICSNILSVFILAFLFNIIDRWIPMGKTVRNWYFLRILSIFLSIGLHYLFFFLCSTFLPDVLVAYAPMILLGTLFVLFALGVLKVFLSLVLAMVHPILGGIYAFLFSSKFGKQLSKAVLTTLMVTAIVYILEHLGYGVICISATALLSYIPLLLLLLLLWYLVDHLF